MWPMEGVVRRERRKRAPEKTEMRAVSAVTTFGAQLAADLSVNQPMPAQLKQISVFIVNRDCFCLDHDIGHRARVKCDGDK